MAGSYILDEQSEAFIEGLVERCRYETAGDALRDSIGRMQAREEKLDALRAEIQKGFDSGPGREVDGKTLAEEVINAAGGPREARRWIASAEFCGPGLYDFLHASRQRHRCRARLAWASEYRA